MILRKPASLALLAALFLALPSPGAAQTASGTLSGVVRDDSGGILAGAGVTARNMHTGIARRATTDASGRYNMANLDPGEYELRAELQGFKTVVRGAVV